ncbi:hypothetical protein ACQQ2N_12040 [Dokdonella sp. MW10]|uniref:hypothetical protein n=1 Tax=Dokdonella sp. MW10 TaxID=2992926 RepID=UPI003F7F9312
MHRTTKRALRAACVLLGLLASLTAVQALAATDDATITMSLELPPHAPHLPPDLVIEGSWPESCLPVIERTMLQGRDIEVRLRASTRGCTETPSPVTLRTNPAIAGGWRELPLGTYRVRLFLRHGDGPERLVAFRLLEAGAREYAPRPESGFWWAVPTDDGMPPLNGSGLAIERQGNELAVSLLTYENGAPTWRFGSTKLEGGTARIAMMRMSGGGEPFQTSGSTPHASPDLALNLDFRSPAEVDAWMVVDAAASGSGLREERAAFSRVPFADGQAAATWRGRWIFTWDQSDHARVLTLTTTSNLGNDRFRLATTENDIALECRMATSGARRPPDLCTLSDGLTVLATFDGIGIDRMKGRALDGGPVQLTRVSN